MKEIRSDGETLAIVIKKGFGKNGVNFVSKESFPLQLGISNYKKGVKVKPHFHLQKRVFIETIQEVVHIERGEVLVDIYNLDGQKSDSIKLSKGDTIFFVGGGHGFEMLENTRIIEVKQGPYFGKKNDKKMIE